MLFLPDNVVIVSSILEQGMNISSTSDAQLISKDTNVNTKKCASRLAGYYSNTDRVPIENTVP